MYIYTVIFCYSLPELLYYYNQGTSITSYNNHVHLPHCLLFDVTHAFLA